MATSSIKKNFVISGKEEVEAFADAVEAAANDIRPIAQISARKISDSKELNELMRRWRKAND